MSTSGTYNSSWQQRVSGTSTAPDRRDLRISNARKIHARMVSASSGIVAYARYAVDHPIDFLISTATSAATFMAVKALIGVTIGAFFPALGFGLAAAMLTSGILCVGRGLGTELKARRHRIDNLYYSDTPPTKEDLANARHIDMAGVIQTGIQRALFTGFLSGLVGGAIGYMASDWVQPGGSPTMPTEGQYDRFLNDLGKYEAKGDYGSDTNRFGFKGKYQFGEMMLADTGYYSLEDADGNKIDDFSKNDWDGRWTGKDGVKSLEDFLDNKGNCQENAVREGMQLRWKEIVRQGLDDYVGEEINGVDVTKSGMLAASWNQGVGMPNDDGIYKNGIGKFLKHGETLADGNDVAIETYFKKFANYKVPFAVGVAEQMPFYVPGAYVDCLSPEGYTWPVNPDEVNRVSSHYGWRDNPLKPGTPQFHHGLDFAAVIGTDVGSIADGTVEDVVDKGSRGRSVSIRHDNGYLSVYRHLSTIHPDMKVGEPVRIGQMIGEVGQSGRATGPHLHLGLFNPEGKSINPEPCLPDMNVRGFRR